MSQAAAAVHCTTPPRNSTPSAEACRSTSARDQPTKLWAIRDYFWALKAGLLGGHSAQMWTSFRAGYCGSGTADTVRQSRNKGAVGGG